MGRVWRWGVLTVALAAIALSLTMLERGRAGIDRTALFVGETPVTLYQQPGADGPLVVVAHGFAGSRRMMEGYALTLAHAGYRVASFDFEGHGANAVPMSGDVTAVDGTTARLVRQTLAVIAAMEADLAPPGIVLLGHSMATDVVVRAAAGRGGVDAVVAISMYSEAVTADAPRRLLMISGEWEPHLRAAALEAMAAIDPAAGEGETVEAGAIVRRAAVSPKVEHVGVLHARTALSEARAWIDTAFGRGTAEAPVISPGPWVIFLLGGVMALGWPLAALLGQPGRAPRLGWRALVPVVFLPALTVPLVLSLVEVRVLPVLVADYLALHLGLYGLVQLWLLARAGVRLGPIRLWAGLALAAYGIAVFGLALDRYGASFVPHAGRVPVIAGLALGAVPFMLADARLIYGAGLSLGQAAVARLGLILSLGLAVALDPGALFFLIIVLPVILLYFAVFGTMGGWVARRAGWVAAGAGQGAILAWALGVSFPLFAP